MHLTGLDIIVLIAILGGATFGLLRGFVAEMIALGAWIASIFAIKLFLTPVARLLTHVVGSESGAKVLAFALIFLIVYAGGKLIAGALSKGARASVLGPFDRVLGFGFGALKGLIIVTVAYLVFNLGFDLLYGTTSPRPEMVRNARTYPLVNATGRAIVDWVGQHRKGGLIGSTPATPSKAEPAKSE